MISLLEHRNNILHSKIQNLVDHYVKKHSKKFVILRNCIVCGGMFAPRSRWHVIDTEECRREWNRGQIHPSPDGNSTAKRKRA